jgi:putative ABC transport system substrate-binding protein
MKRREFMSLLGGAATWSLAASAQQSERMRRVGVLMNLPSDNLEGMARLAAFLQGDPGWQGCDAGPAPFGTSTF